MGAVPWVDKYLLLSTVSISGGGGSTWTQKLCQQWWTSIDCWEEDKIAHLHGIVHLTE